MVRELELGNRAPSFQSPATLSRVLGVQPYDFFLPAEGAERFDRRKLLGLLKDELQRDIEKRFDKYQRLAVGDAVGRWSLHSIAWRLQGGRHGA